MNARKVVLCAGAVWCVTGGVWAGDKPELRLNDRGAIGVTPKRIARVAWNNGSPVLAGEWQDYSAGSVRAADAVFDCYGDADNDSLQLPDDATCGMGSSRWFFGPSYCNMFASNDMANVAGSTMNGVQYAWYWFGDGSSFNSSTCIVVLFTQESNPDACEADSFDYSGVALSYGPIPNNPGGYYVNQGWVDLTGIELTVPDFGSGSYVTIFANSISSTSITLAQCAQPMLWGCSNNGGDPGRQGTQEEGQLDDDNPIDGTHDVSTECYSYDFTPSGVCPGVLGTMFMARGSDACDPGVMNVAVSSRVTKEGAVWDEYEVTVTFDIVLCNEPDEDLYYDVYLRERDAVSDERFGPVRIKIPKDAWVQDWAGRWHATRTVVFQGISEYYGTDWWIFDDDVVLVPPSEKVGEAGGGVDKKRAELHDYSFYVANDPNLFGMDTGALAVRFTAGDLVFDLDPPLTRGDLREIVYTSNRPPEPDNSPLEATVPYTVEFSDGTVVTGRICGPRKCKDDFNGDGSVNTLDILAFLNSWTGEQIPADCNSDQQIDTRDVICVLNEWTAGCF